jgi:hypothetical protein
MVFCFGSNLKGAHGAGAALDALKNHGAVLGKGEGLYGNSYAIPTKDDRIKTLPIERVEYYVDRFIEFAKANPSKQFQVTRIGCGLAGFRDEDIAPMFLGSPENVFFDSKWAKFGLTQSWGTFG